MPTPNDDLLAGIPAPVAATLSRVPMRMRESNRTLSAWKMSVVPAHGPEGAIVLVDSADGGVVFRGEGIFLGWNQERLAAVHTRLLPPAPESETSTLQLG